MVFTKPLIIFNITRNFDYLLQLDFKTWILHKFTAEITTVRVPYTRFCKIILLQIYIVFTYEIEELFIHCLVTAVTIILDIIRIIRLYSLWNFMPDKEQAVS